MGLAGCGRCGGVVLVRVVVPVVLPVVGGAGCGQRCGRAGSAGRELVVLVAQVAPVAVAVILLRRWWWINRRCAGGRQGRAPAVSAGRAWQLVGGGEASAQGGKFFLSGSRWTNCNVEAGNERGQCVFTASLDFLTSKVVFF